MEKEIIMFPVIYNGQTDLSCTCDDPSILQKGKVYWVNDVEQGDSYTLYFLEGIQSSIGFNTAWFDDIPSYEAVMLIGPIPKVGSYLKNYRRRLFNGKWERKSESSMIERVYMISTDRFIVYTQNSCYFLTR